jgi:hypothetical protein
MTSFIPVRQSRRILLPLPSTPLQVTPLTACHRATRSSSTHYIDPPTTPTKQQCVSIVSPERNILKSTQISKETKWHSPEAVSLFVSGPKRRLETKEKNMEAVDVKQHIHSQISILRAAYLSVDGWKNIVNDGDTANLCSAFDIFVIRLKARYLSTTLTQALSDYEDTKNFIEICAKAIQKIDNIDFDGNLINGDDETKGIICITSPRTVMQRLRDFRSDSCFPNPAQRRRRTRNLPPIFLHNPDLYESFMLHVKLNLSTLSAEMLHDYLMTIALPETVKK